MPHLQFLMADSPTEKSRWIAALNFFRAEAQGVTVHRPHHHHHYHHDSRQGNATPPQLHPYHTSREGSATPPPVPLHTINTVISASSPTLSTPPLVPFSSPPHGVVSPMQYPGGGSLFGLNSPLRSFGRTPSSPLARSNTNSNGSSYHPDQLGSSASTVVASAESKFDGLDRRNSKRWSAGSILRGTK